MCPWVSEGSIDASLLSAILALLRSLKTLTLLVHPYSIAKSALRPPAPPPSPFPSWQCLQGSKKENFGTEKWGTGKEEDLFFNLWVLATLSHNVPPDSWDSQFEKHWRMTFLLPLFLCRKRMKLWQSRNSRTVKVYIYFFFLYLVFVNRIWKRWNLAD